MDFATLKTETESWLLDLPSGMSSRVGGWVNEAIRDAARRHNFRFMQSILFTLTQENDRTLTDVGGSPLVLTDVTPEWKEARGRPYIVHQDGSVTEIDWGGSLSEMNRTYAIQNPAEGNETPVDNGQPRYVLWGDEITPAFTGFFIYPAADLLSGWDDGKYRLRLPYWFYPDALAGNNDENHIASEGPYYVIFKAAALGFAWARDEEREQMFERKAEKEFQALRRLDKNRKLPERVHLRPNKSVYKPRSRLGLRG